MLHTFFATKYYFENYDIAFQKQALPFTILKLPYFQTAKVLQNFKEE